MIYRRPIFLVVVTFGPFTIPSPVSKLPLFLSLPVCRRSSLLTGEGVGEEPNHANARKPGPLKIIQYSLFQTIVEVRAITR